MHNLQAQGTPLVGDGDTFDAHCCIYCVLGDCSWVLQVRCDVLKMRKKSNARPLQIRTREDIRERYSIRGDAIGDCVASWCCRPCALTQERREIELEENSF
jgi:Cys-rich protein (TIGR01571 family)